MSWLIDYGKSRKGNPVGYQIGRRNGSSPLYVWFGGHQFTVHVLIWIWMTGSIPTFEVDHENRNHIDNRWENLREATRSQNQANTGLYRNNKSGIRGVTYVEHRSGWRAMICIAGKNQHIGYFDKKEDAEAAWLAAASDQHGDFAFSPG